jgi:15-cis-phytoene synthase
MGLKSATWEYQLLSWAHEALISPAIDNPIKTEPDILDSAYDYCARVTRTNSRTFYMASSFLPYEKRRAAQALYAFCRSTDDLVDETLGMDRADEVFANWRARLSNPYPAAHDPVPHTTGLCRSTD